jgi:sortase A
MAVPPEQEAAADEEPVVPGNLMPGSRYRSVEVDADATASRRRGLAWGWLANKVLLIIEILIVLGLLYVAAQFFLLRAELNKEAVVAQPTLTPTIVRPLIDVVVLPSGHRPPDAAGNAVPLDPVDEIPEHLRGRVQPVTPLPIATAGPGQPTRIVIPTIKVDAAVVVGDSWVQLQKGVGHHPGTANPGQRGNMVLSAHNDIYGEIFRYLDQLKPGDEFVVYSGAQSFRYVVTQQRIVEPTEVSVMYPTSDATATLITCYPYWVDNKRVVVMAQLQP